MSQTIPAQISPLGTCSNLLAEDIALCLDVLSQLTPRDLRTIPPDALARGLAQTRAPSAPTERELLHLLDDYFFAALTTDQARAIESHGANSPFKLHTEIPLRSRISTAVTTAGKAANRMSAAQVVHFLARLGDQPPSALNAFFDVYGERISPDVRNRIQSTRSLMSWARTTTRPMPL